jgi:FkbM family methyltransferase
MNRFKKILKKFPIIYYFIFTIRHLTVVAIKTGDLVKLVDLKLLETWHAHISRIHLYSKGLVMRGRSLGKSYMLEEVEFMNGDVIVDCGANLGDLQLYFRYLGISVDYYGIEPNPQDFDSLLLNLLPNSKGLNIALWDSESELSFYVDSESASSSLIEPPTYSGIIKISARRMDQLNLPAKIKLLKVEGEGAEPEILKGAIGMLNRIQFISVDCGPERGIDQLETKKEVCEFLVNNNFSIVKENPYHRKTILFVNNNVF